MIMILRGKGETTLANHYLGKTFRENSKMSVIGARGMTRRKKKR